MKYRQFVLCLLTALIVGFLPMKALSYVRTAGGSDSPVFTIDTINPVTNLSAPIGGENWFMGGTFSVTWSASDTNLGINPITLEIKTDSTGAWQTLESELSNTGIFDWLIPPEAHPHVWLKVSAIDSFGNIGTDANEPPFSIGNAPPQSPQNLQLQIINGLDAYLSWSEVTQNVLGHPITPSAYLVFYNQTSNPDDDDAYFLLHTNTTETEYSQINATISNSTTFYRIVAVTEPSHRLHEMLQSKPDANSNPISLPELRQLLSGKPFSSYPAPQSGSVTK